MRETNQRLRSSGEPGRVLGRSGSAGGPAVARDARRCRRYDAHGRDRHSCERIVSRTEAIAAAIVTLLLAGPATAGEWDLTGFAGIDTRVFPEGAAHRRQHSGPDASLLLRPELYWQSGDGALRFGFVGYARADARDSERTHADVREASLGFAGNGWDLTVGIDKVFWGVTESRHLVDVINQTDLAEDIDQEDKLGQPMVNLNLQRDFGRIEMFALPWFRERTFPGAEGRLRAPLPVDADAARYESSRERNHTDLALRYSHYFGDVDFAAYLFDGTSREPLLALAPEGDRLLPFYEQMTQAGVELQYTRDTWLWKLEAIGHDAASDSFFAMVGGLEYTFYSVRDSAADVGLLIEYLHDGRNGDAPPTPFDDDIFAGTRLTLNDAADTSLLAGIAVDLNEQETFLNVEAERRFGDSIVAELRLRAFGNTVPGSALHAVRSDDYLQLRVSWYY